MLPVRILFAIGELLISHFTLVGINRGIFLGMVLGISPFFSLQWWMATVGVMCIACNVLTVFISIAFFSFVQFLLISVFEHWGENILQMRWLFPVFQNLRDLPIIPLTRFNEPVVMGSLVFSLSLVSVIILLFTLIIRFKHQDLEFWYLDSFVFRYLRNSSFPRIDEYIKKSY